VPLAAELLRTFTIVRAVPSGSIAPFTVIFIALVGTVTFGKAAALLILGTLLVEDDDVELPPPKNEPTADAALFMALIMPAIRL
jgi:hypothetical protein